MGQLDGKVAVITGGAGGMGSAAAELFIREGASVLIVDRNEAELKAAADRIGSDRIAAFAGDVTDPKTAEAYAALAAERFGGLDITLLNAGITGPNQRLENYPLETFEEVMNVNVKGVWLGLKASIPHMRKRGGGSIVITSSIQGLAAMPGTTGYTTSKHAVVGMMKGAALELARSNIRVNAIHPGFAATPMMDRIHRSAGSDAAAQGVHDALAATVPMRRYAEPEEIARMMLFLASDASSYCTGASFPIDGGILASWSATPG